MLTAVIIAVVIALIVCPVLWSGMKMSSPCTADSYAPGNGIAVSAKYDRFTHRTQSRVRINDSSK
jgi:hypothetical protein